MEKWIDISMSIHHDMMVYKDKEEKRPIIETRADHDHGDHHESSICMDLHTGTHIDMPLHMVKDGGNSSEFKLSSVNGSSVVLDLKEIHRRGIEREDLFPFDEAIESNDIVVLKTENSFQDAFDFEFVYLAESGAAYLKEKEIKCVGIDALGVERSQSGHPTHKILLTNGIYIIEGLALKEVEAGRYDFLCLPIKIENVEGLPARVLISPK